MILESRIAYRLRVVVRGSGDVLPQPAIAAIGRSYVTSDEATGVADRISRMSGVDRVVIYRMMAIPIATWKEGREITG